MRYALEGSVQSAGSRIRISAQLIDTESGAHLRAERFDKPYADLLDTQDEVAARLARTIHVELIAAESRRPSRARADRLDSLDHTLNGWAACANRLKSIRTGRFPNSSWPAHWRSRGSSQKRRHLCRRSSPFA